MQTFTYSALFKFIFRFGNILVTLLLIIYIIPIAWYLDENLFLLIPFIVSLSVLFIINRTYFTYYKILPYKIEADEEKMICSNFLLSNKVITIYYRDITQLKGGIFDGRLSGVLKVCDNNNVCIGFSQKMKNSSKLITLILSKVNKELYDKVIENLSQRKKKNPGK